MTIVRGGQAGSGLDRALGNALHAAEIVQKLTTGISQADFESQVKAFIADWEAKNNGGQPIKNAPTVNP